MSIRNPHADLELRVDVTGIGGLHRLVRGIVSRARTWIARTTVQRREQGESAREEDHSRQGISFYRTSGAWGIVAAVALLWPSRAIGPLDGIPLDARLEAVAIGLLFPVLCWLHPDFLRSRRSRTIVLALLSIKLIAALLLVQEGWCARFITPAPLNADANLTQLSWDARADWRGAVPRCSAIVARPYPDVWSFPAWFLNLAGPPDRPPRALVAMTIDGYVAPRAPGTLSITVTEGQRILGTIDDRTIDDRSGTFPMTGGVHRVHLWTTLTGGAWRFIPQWNGSDLFSSVLTTTDEPRRIDGVLWRATRVAVAALAFALFVLWAGSAAASLALPPLTVMWLTGMTAISVAAGMADIHKAGRLAVLPVLAAVFIPLPQRLRNARGAFLLIGVPWFAVFLGSSLADVGRFTLFTPGDDFSLFQRFTYRIFMQGYWLEGGQWTFWYQPLYRWVIGPVHIVFGDSSIGEWYLDAACLWLGALFAFIVCSRAASFRWGLAGAALTLATVAIGPSWWIVGRDLSEITAAGFAYAAALLVITNRRVGAGRIVLAGVLAVLSFYTRLNHLLWMAGLTALFLPIDVRAGAVWRPSAWLPRMRLKHAIVFLLVLASGVVAFAWRTWYYTGVFSILLGTQHELVATVQPGDSFRMAIVHMIQSLLVQITVQDPPRFDPRAIPVIAGIGVSLLGLLRVPWCRDVPAGPAAFCVAGLAGALVARGTAYIGRFSIHLMPIAVAIAVCFAASLVTKLRLKPPSDEPAAGPRIFVTRRPRSGRKLRQLLKPKTCHIGTDIGFRRCLGRLSAEDNVVPS